MLYVSSNNLVERRKLILQEIAATIAGVMALSRQWGMASVHGGEPDARSAVFHLYTQRRI